MNSYIFLRIILCFQILLLVTQYSYGKSYTRDVSDLIDIWDSKDGVGEDEVVTKILNDHIHLHTESGTDQDIFLSISNHLFDDALYKEGLRYFELINTMVVDESVFKGELTYHLGRFYNANNNANQAEMYFGQSLEMICDSKYLYKIYTELVDVYLKKQMFNSAQKMGYLTLELCRQYGASDMEYYEILNMMMRTYVRLSDYEKADYYMKKLFFYAHKINQSRYFYRASLSKAALFMSSGRFDEGISELDKIKIGDDQPTSIKQTYYYYKGLASYVYRDYPEAVNLFRRGLQNPNGIKKHKLAINYSWLGDSFAWLCQFDNAIQVTKQALDIYLENPNQFNIEIRDNYNSLATYNYHKGDTDSALCNLLEAKKYSKGNIKSMIGANSSLITQYTQLLKDDYSAKTLEKLFTVIYETNKYVLDWNFNRQYIENDEYREYPIKTFYERTLESLYFLYEYTKHPLVGDLIVNYSSSLQSLIYYNNQMKFNPFIRNTTPKEVRDYEISIKHKIALLKKEIKSSQDDEEDVDYSSSMYFLDSLEVLKSEYKKVMSYNTEYLYAQVDIWGTSNSIIRDIQKELKPEEAIINYYNSKKYLYSTVISQDTVSFFRKKLDAKTLEYIEEYKSALSTPNLIDRTTFENAKIQYSESATKLYDFLLKEELENLNGKTKHLYIITYDMLNSFSFKSLLQEYPEPGTSFKNYPYLAMSYSVAYDYSLYSLLYNKTKKRKHRAHSYIGFSPDYRSSELSETSDHISADSLLSNFEEFVLRGGVVDLPGAKQSVRHNSSQFKRGKYITGDEATKKNLKQHLGTSDIIHLAMHAVIDPESPELSQFIFSGTDQDLNLHAYELFDMNLDTELAMLSACDTGKGDVHSGNSLQSISQAFSLAGASSLTTSFYKIPDAQTAIIDKYFIEYVNEGVRLDESLRLSNMKYLEESSEKYAHPFYWAGIALSGKTEPLKRERKSILHRLFM